MDTNFISEMFKKFSKRLGIQFAIPSLYNHKSNGQAESCIKFVKMTIKLAMKLMLMYMSLLQIK